LKRSTGWRPLSGWLVGWLVDWLVSWLVHWLADWLVGWLVGWLTVWLAGYLVGWWQFGWQFLLACQVDWPVVTPGLLPCTFTRQSSHAVDDPGPWQGTCWQVAQAGARWPQALHLHVRWTGLWLQLACCLAIKHGSLHMKYESYSMIILYDPGPWQGTCWQVAQAGAWWAQALHLESF
jgi:hypothetical protein